MHRIVARGVGIGEGAVEMDGGDEMDGVEDGSGELVGDPVPQSFSHQLTVLVP